MMNHTVGELKMKGKCIKRLYKSKLFNFLIITVLGVGILFNIIYASAAINQDTNVYYMKANSSISMRPHCGNSRCEPFLKETVLNCPEDCFLP